MALSRKIRILGDFFLENPLTAQLEPEHRAIVTSALPGLAQLEARDLNVFPQGVPDMNESFENFQTREAQAWIDAGYSPPPPKELLVKPSGTFSAKIVHLLNQPSLTTQFPENGEVADCTNPSIAMVMGNAYNAEHAFLIDQVLRREAKSEALQDYPTSVLNAHKEYVSWLLDHVAAKITVVYGKKVQKCILNDSRYRFTPFPLWGEFEGVLLFLLHESSCHNQQQNFEFRRAIIFCKHPERFFMEPRDSDESSYQSRCIEVAARIAGKGIPYIPRYYEEKKWRPLIPNAHELTFIKAANDLTEHMLHTEETLSTPNIQVASTERDTDEIQLFDQHPHSNDILRELLPAVIEDTHNSDIEWQSVEDIPDSVMKWFKGQKDISFPDTIIRDLSDIPLAFDKAFDHRLKKENKHSATSTKHALLQIMIWQFEDLRFIRGSHQDLWHSRFDLIPFETRCMTCNVKGKEDESPRWFVSMPGCYIVKGRKGACLSTGCKGKTKRLLPLNPDVSHYAVHLTDRTALSRTNLPTPLDLTPYLHSQASAVNAGLPSIVTSWCIKCKEGTIVQDVESGIISNIFEDKHTRFTLGVNRHLYVERRPSCKACEAVNRAQGRFVPIDLQIESVHPNSLRSFIKIYGNQPLQVRKILLNHWPRSKTEKRMASIRPGR